MKHTYYIIKRYLTKKEYGLIFLLVFVILLAAISAVWPVYLMKGVIDTATGGTGNMTKVIWLGVAYIIFRAGRYTRDFRAGSKMVRKSAS